jgi:serine/threonine protein kinase
MALLEGQNLGPYHIIGQLGQGGMATVFKAYHPKLDRYVAIKIMHQAFQEDPAFLARFEREAQIVARLEHPHIVPIHDISDINGQPYLVLKFIEGRTLKAFLTEGPLTLDQITTMMAAVADALDYAHSQGVLHRDIKPSNIIIDKDGMAYLTDFGLARMVQAGESTVSQDMLIGTPQYISPEQAMGKKELDARTDIYSMGVVLYELVVGRVPFSADTPYAIIHDHIYRPLPLPTAVNPEIPVGVERVLLKALAKNQADRYESAGEMMNAFRDAVQSSGLTQLNPDRVASAAVSLAKLREQQDMAGASQVASIPAAVSSAPAVPAPTRGSADPFNFDFAPAASSAPAVSSAPAAPPLPAPPARPQWPPPPGTPGADLSPREFGRQARKAAQEMRREARRQEREKVEWSWTPPEDWAGKVQEWAEKLEDTFGGKMDMLSDDDDSIRRRVEKRIRKRQEWVTHLVVFGVINVLLWAIYFFTSRGNLSVLPGEISGTAKLALSFPWPLIVSIGWGSGLLAHGVDTLFQTGKRAEAQDTALRQALYDQYGENWREKATKEEFRKIRRRVERPFKKRSEFYSHLVVYVMINLMLWGIFLFSGSFLKTVLDGQTAQAALSFPWPLIVMLGWGAGLVGHALDTFGTINREKAIDREVERERQRLMDQSLVSEKPKNDFASGSTPVGVRLTGDGEFTESMVAEQDELQKPKRRQGG